MFNRVRLNAIPFINCRHFPGGNETVSVTTKQSIDVAIEKRQKAPSPLVDVSAARPRDIPDVSHVAQIDVIPEIGH